MMGNSILNNTSVPSMGTGMMQQFQQFKNTFSGNPQQVVNQLLNSGKINNAQLQQAMQMAKQFQHFVK